MEFQTKLCITLGIICLIPIGIVIYFIGFPTIEENPEGALYFQNSPFGEVKVLDDNILRINNRKQCSFTDLPETQSEKIIVNYTLTPLTSRDIDVLNIGLGCGGTLSKIIEFTDKKIDIVEINLAVIRANQRFSDVLKNEQINLIESEGLAYLRKSDKKYDSIIIDIENPAVVYSSNLYTKEAFDIISNSLKEKGTFGLWMYPCRHKEYYDITYNTLKKSFNYVYHKYGIIFVASQFPLEFEDYLNYTDSKRINTIDKKVLSTFFLNNCWEEAFGKN